MSQFDNRRDSDSAGFGDTEPSGKGDLDTGTGESGGFADASGDGGGGLGSDAGNTSESDSSFGDETGEFRAGDSSADVENS